MTKISALFVLLPGMAMAEEPAAAPVMDEVVVTAPKVAAAVRQGEETNEAQLAAQRPATSDSAHLLQDTPGVSLYGAGGVSSLPAIHGMADDRLRVQVDGMDLQSACPNHMNSPLSYIDPTRVASATVLAGITPVSVGGDSIGGTIQVKSAPPEFAKDGETLKKGRIGAFYRSNGKAQGANVAAMLATQNINLAYNGSTAKSDNYRAGKDFKTAGSGTPGSLWLAGNEVGSSAYRLNNQDVGIALRQEGHLLQLKVGRQDVGFEGFPNQRMDMTSNTSTQANLHYAGEYQWGQMEGRIYRQKVRHGMNMGADRFSYGTLGMPMETEAETLGGQMQGNIVLSEEDLLRIGTEYQRYTLNDWWPPSGGMMGPNTYWNVDFGTRDRLDFFGEWETFWGQDWISQLGVRSDFVKSNAAAVQGYNSAALWASDAAAFNAQARQRTDQNWDMTAQARNMPDGTHTFEAGYARKSRSPNLYQRYAWSTQPMASLMNNFIGDGNGYIGNVALRPEVAHTLSATGDWHDAEEEKWQLKLTGYYTYVQDYIDAQRCNFGQCGGTNNLTTTMGFVNLEYLNQSARIYGLDMSGHAFLGSGDWGRFSGAAVLNYLRGKNTATGDNLYNMMPLNARLSMQQHAGGWRNTAEIVLVASKTQVSHVRNEMQTAGYGLLNLRGSYEWKQLRLDLGIENVFNRGYSMPLGGAYVGQGASMSTNSIPWGIVVPGMGRSLNVALNVNF